MSPSLHAAEWYSLLLYAVFNFHILARFAYRSHLEKCSLIKMIYYFFVGICTRNAELEPAGLCTQNWRVKSGTNWCLAAWSKGQSTQNCDPGKLLWNHILINAWQHDERVKALKIVIQVNCYEIKHWLMLGNMIKGSKHSKLLSR
jgi:hypothetical protein